jgi:hypothetical protein
VIGGGVIGLEVAASLKGSAPGMLALTRRRDPDARQETWLIYYGNVRVGTKTHPRARRALSAASP